jgi:monoamine oxidase
MERWALHKDDAHLTQEDGKDASTSKSPVKLLGHVAVVAMVVVLLGPVLTSVDLPDRIPIVMDHGEGADQQRRRLSSESTTQFDACPPADIVIKKFIVVGAGAAGLTAAKRLQLLPETNPSACFKPEVTVLEASSRIGGRAGKNTAFAGFPIDTGPSWVYDKARLPYVAQDPHINKKIKHHLKAIYATDDFKGYLPVYGSPKQVIGDTRSISRRDLLWYNYSWFDFFEEHVASSIPSNKMILDCPVDKIHYQKQRQHVAVSCGSRVFIADHVIVTVSLDVLLSHAITFQPPLPRGLLGRRESMMGGFKIFFEFADKFYDDVFGYYVRDFEGSISARAVWWDASKIKAPNSTINLVAGVYEYHQNKDWNTLSNEPEQEIVQQVLQDLDGHFGHFGSQLATSNYVDHLLIPYTVENFPFIQALYPNDYGRYDEAGPQDLYRNKHVMIAGDAFPVPEYHVGWVCAASLSGLHAVERILSDIEPSIDWYSIPRSIWNKEHTDSTIWFE